MLNVTVPSILEFIYLKRRYYVGVIILNINKNISSFEEY